MITRRTALAGVLALTLPLPRLGRADGLSDVPSTPDAMVAAAKALAEQDFRPPPRQLLAPFDALDFDSYRGIRPRAGYAGDLPLGEQFRADLLPPGWLFPEPVYIALPGHDTRFKPEVFTYDPRLVTPPAPGAGQDTHSADMGFSGLRLRTPLNHPERWDEVLVLQGASYFRALARDTVYGLSARALALGTGGPVPEEFPVTRAIRVFAAGSQVQFGCLIDSARASAALIATLTPGGVTRMDCALHLFARETLSDAGIAPLTSMFQHNGLGPARIDDFRPGVHDSDVLLIDNGAGERLWRPLANPASLQMSAFVDNGPRGFGLIQSKTSFADFQDAEGAYQRRPSAWVAPRGDWGRGAVMLLEIPTMDEFADNIVAFWRPETPLARGPHRFDYELSWRAPGPDVLEDQRYPLVPVRAGSGIEPNDKLGRLFVLDFATMSGHQLATLPDMSVTAGPGTVIDGTALYAVADRPGVIRASFVLTPDAGTDSTELRLQLQDAAGAAMAPVWLYRWTRRADGNV
jgi:periplasmic glucans biosynthesis protein